MGSILLDATGVTDRSAVSVSVFSENQHIDGCTVVVKDGTTTTGQTHVQVFVFHGSPTIANVVHQLIDDYIYGTHAATWDGNFSLEGNEGLWLIIRDSNAITARMTARVQRIPA